MKKTLTIIVTILISFYAQANDTSGCSPMREAIKHLRTVNGSVLKVQQSMAPWASCWNADSGFIDISYQWVQNNDDKSRKIIFWTKINDNEQSLKAKTTCKINDTISYSYDSNSTYLCQGTIQVKVGYQERLNVEIAPQVDGDWDTRGYSNNYIFNF